MPTERQPWRIRFVVGPICEAGQHGACAATQDAYAGDVERPGPIWVCACECHEHEGGIEGRE